MQRYRTVIVLLLLVAVPLAAAAVAARFFMPGTGGEPGRAEAKQVAPGPAEKPKIRKIFVAARKLPVGTLVTDEDLTTLDLPEKEIRRAHLAMDGPKAVDALRGHAVREPVAAGAPLVRSAVVGPGQRGFLAAVLKPGTRAVTIRLGKGARHAGLIDPGDRVDVILTAKLRLEGRVQTVFARTILEDVRVVAVDRQVGASTETPEGGKRVKRTEILTATLEVSPAQADRLALGEHEGELSLAVRSLIGAVERVRNETVDLQELLSLTKEAPPSSEPATPAPPPPIVEEPATRAVLAAVRALPVGTLLTGEDFAEIEIAAEDVRREHVVAADGAAIESLRGYAVREPVGAGAALTWSSVVGPGQRGFLAAVLDPGTRAVTIQLGKGTRHAGLIDPGDRVDVILTAKLALDGGVQSVFTRRILEDVRVVAVDRELGAAAGAAQPNDPIKRTSISTATLEVSPAQADLLALGEHQGTLALAVRSLAARAGTAGGEAVNLRQLLGHPLSERAEPPGERIELEAPALAEPEESEFASPKTVRVIRGSELTRQTFPDPARPQTNALPLAALPEPAPNPAADDRRPGPATEAAR